MESLFSKRIDALRAAAADDIERKVLTGNLLLMRRVFLWAALPLLLALGSVAVLLLYFFLAAKKGAAEVTLFNGIIDIFSIYTGSLVTLIAASLSLVKWSDRKLSLLSSLRPDDTDYDDPVSVEAIEPPYQDRADAIPLSEDDVKTDIPNSPDADDDRQWESSRSVCESVG